MKITKNAAGLASAGLIGVSLLKSVYGKMRGTNHAGKVAVVTGASRGLGFLVACELAKAGCKVAICARNPEELEKASRELRLLTNDIIALPCDVAKPEEVKSFFQQVKSQFGPVDILVNNAGVIQVAPLENIHTSDFEEAMAIMYWGVFHPTMEVVSEMKKRGEGYIINITSLGGVVSVPHLLPYCTSKFASVGLSQGLHAELKQHNIHVTTVIPGTMRTGSHLQAMFGGDKRHEFQWFSLGASLPIISKDAQAAAKSIVRTLKSKKAVLILGLPAKAVVRLNGLMPGLMSEALALINRLLPSPGDPNQKTGEEVATEHDFTVLKKVTMLGQKAAEKFQNHQKTGTE